MGKAENGPKDIGPESNNAVLNTGVNVGDCVEFKFAGEESEKVRFVPAGQAKDCEVGKCVAADSPLGVAMGGHGVGDTVKFKTPMGEQTITIVGIGSCEETNEEDRN